MALRGYTFSLLGPIHDHHNPLHPRTRITARCWDDLPHRCWSKTGTAEHTPVSSGSWGPRPEHNCSTADVAASAAAVVAIGCCSCRRIVVGRADGGTQNQIAVSVAVVAAAAAVFLGIRVVATKSLVVDMGRPTDGPGVAGCRATGVVGCRSSLRVARCIGAQETRTESMQGQDRRFMYWK